ncbi:MAG: N-acyl homoserine lactonase family protein [Candidatus Aminicenantes bacterium]|nr:N-acyl homoserine lactonase family protein [Candidatus Aminicenantes bacterium]
MNIKPLPISKESPIDKGFMTYLFGYGTEITIGVYMWVIQGAGKHIVVDTGASGELIRSTGFPGIDFQTQEEALGKIGLTPDDIDIVILTHLHKDHASDISKFKNAVFFIQKDELDYARNPHPTQAGWFVVPPEGTKLEIIDGDAAVEPGLEIIETPGHTPGTQSVLIDTDKGKACISGLCTIEENFDPPEALKKMGVQAIAPGIHIDALQAFDSVQRIQKAADIIIAPHDIKYFDGNTLPG